MIDRSAPIALLAPVVVPLGLPQKRYADAVLGIAAGLYGVAPEAIHQRDRSLRVAEVRQIVMLALRDHGRFTLQEVGDYLKRDHSTVHHGIERTRKRLRVDPVMEAVVHRLGEVPRPNDAAAVEAFEGVTFFTSLDGLLFQAASLLASAEKVVLALRREVDRAERERQPMITRGKG